MNAFRLSRSAARVGAGCALALFLFAGCAPMLMVPLQTELEHPRHAWRSDHGMRITGFVANDGMYHRYDGWVKLQGDTLAFHGAPSQNEYGQPEHRMAVAQVTTLFSRMSTTRKVTSATIGILIGLGLVGLAALALAGAGTGS